MEYSEYRGNYECDVSDLVGKVFDFVGGEDGDDELVFQNADGKFTFYHQQDCCESVYIESIVGDLSDLVGEEILGAEEVTHSNDINYGSETWTFYKFRTRKGYVDVRWCGSSNGYYSESVDMKFEKA